MRSLVILAILMSLVGINGTLHSQGDKKEGKPERRKGELTGVVTGKGDNWIEVKADGEEKARKYVPHWRGGNPNMGGGPDKAMEAELKKVPLKSRVRLEWSFEERPRVEKIEVLK
ncbi:MAG: hypothetical protein FJ261_00650 [Planctomycetes bacterium]|nr:hypothetical protein [Planctomycetota bacterium]